MIFMAKLHSKKHGRAKSRKPVIKDNEIQKISDESKQQITNLIIEYAKKGISPAVIGEKLKKEHKVPYVKLVLKKGIVKILEENNIKTEIPYDLLDLIKKAVNLQKHLEKNKQDTDNRIKLERIRSKIWRLTKYYINKNSLPEKWRYDPTTAELLVRQK